MNFTIKDLMHETKDPFSRAYWKITTSSFLLLMLSAGMSYSSLIGSVNQIPELIRNVASQEFTSGRRLDFRMIVILLTMIGGMLILSLMVKFLIDILLDNPLEVGGARMMLNAMESDKPVMLASLAYAFDADYLGTVKVMFLKRFFRDMWLLLLVVPGIMKHYEYMMIPYLLAENPYMSSKEAFAKSKQLMTGHKMKAFLIDLYFVPLQLLGIITLGLMTVFYVAPKKNLVIADFYKKIKEEREGEE
ncbi:MAG: DUF975 family protein [Lachnospiraceae bacterium]|nr:DUF975 family protein [Lachnospiraceae bacterium]